MNRMNRNPTPLARRGVPKIVQLGNVNEPEITRPYNVVQGNKASRAAAPSNIIQFSRVYEPRLKVERRYSISSKRSVYRLELVGEHVRRLVGEFQDERCARVVARAYENQGIRIEWVWP